LREREGEGEREPPPIAPPPTTIASMQVRVEVGEGKDAADRAAADRNCAAADVDLEPIKKSRG
jgi:hypothetical protein